jgi:hypothetical protein
MAPRQRLTSTAFAMRAANADTVNGQESSDFINTGQDNSITSNMIVNAAVSTSDIADNAVTSAQIQNGTIEPADLSFTLPDGHSLDAADGDPADAIYVDNEGNVGLDTLIPEGNLHILNTPHSTYHNPELLIEETCPGAAATLWFKSWFNGEDKTWAIGSDTHPYDFFFIQKPGAGQKTFVINSACNVGIGLSNPYAKLTVEGAAGTGGHLCDPNPLFISCLTPDPSIDRPASMIVGVNTYDPTGWGDVCPDGHYELSIGVYGEATDRLANDNCAHTFKGIGVCGIGYGERGVGGYFNSPEGFGLAVVGGKPARFHGGLSVVTGKVGIGTESPITQLQVEDSSASANIKVKSPLNASIDLESTGSYGNFIKFGGNGISKLQFHDRNSGINDLRIINGNVGIGGVNPSYKLHVKGTAYAAGAAGALSDNRYKTNITDLSLNALTIINELRPVSFEWKEPHDSGMEGSQFGFIAQEVEEVLPETVLTQDDEEQTKGLKYDALIPILTKAIQELETENRTLRQEIRQIKAAIGL